MSDRPDRGSVTPLIIGLALALLLLVAGVTAVGSAFLARQDVQHVCDGAAVVAGDSAAGTDGQSDQAVRQQVAAYLDRPARQDLDLRFELRFVDGVPRVTCRGRADISFAGVFALTDVEFEVVAVGRPVVQR